MSYHTVDLALGLPIIRLLPVQTMSAKLSRENLVQVRKIYQQLLADPLTANLGRDRLTSLAIRMLERPGELRLPAELKHLEPHLEQKTKPVVKDAGNKDSIPTDEEDGWEGAGLKLCKQCTKRNHAQLAAPRHMR